MARCLCKSVARVPACLLRLPPVEAGFGLRRDLLALPLLIVGTEVQETQRLSDDAQFDVPVQWSVAREGRTMVDLDDDRLQRLLQHNVNAENFKACEAIVALVWMQSGTCAQGGAGR